MGLFIGNNTPESGITLNVNGGFTTNSGYCHITEYYKVKGRDNIKLALTLYRSRADREAGKDPINCDEIVNNYTIACTTQELTTGDIFVVFYGKLKTQLETVDGWEGKIFDDI